MITSPRISSLPEEKSIAFSSDSESTQSFAISPKKFSLTFSEIVSEIAALFSLSNALADTLLYNVIDAIIAIAIAAAMKRFENDLYIFIKKNSFLLFYFILDPTFLELQGALVVYPISKILPSAKILFY